MWPAGIRRVCATAGIQASGARNPFSFAAWDASPDRVRWSSCRAAPGGDAERAMESSITATLDYLSPKASRPYNFLYPPPDGGTWSNYERNERLVAIGDLH